MKLHAVQDALRGTWISDTASQALGQAKPLFDLAQRQHAAIRGEMRAVDAGLDASAADR